MATLTGTPGPDTIFGTFNDDDIYGFGGPDRLHGRGNNDELYGGRGNDRLEGEWGDDELYGGDGRDDLRGEFGHDELYGGQGRDDLDGGNGHDELYGGKGDDYLKGGFGADELSGGKGGDIFDYDAAGESNSWSMDTICDFSGAGEPWNPGEGDKIDLRDIDADMRWWNPGDQGFDASQLSYDPVSGIFRADIRGHWNDVEIEICGDFDLATDVIV